MSEIANFGWKMADCYFELWANLCATADNVADFLNTKHTQIPGGTHLYGFTVYHGMRIVSLILLC